MPLGYPATDSIGQRCATLKFDGDNTGGIVYIAIRTSGPYSTSDGDIIRSGAGSIYQATMTNTVGRLYHLLKTASPDVRYYWGATLSTGSHCVVGSFTTQEEPAGQDGLLVPGFSH